MAAILYMLISPIGKSYIGVTKQKISKRIRQHVRCNSAVGAALRKYGLKNFKICILAIGPIDYIFRLEDKAIQSFSTMAPSGYNLKEGGYGGRFTDEVRKKMSETAKGRKHSSYRKLKISESVRKSWDRHDRQSEIMRARWADPNQRKKLASVNKGRILSKKHRENLSKSLKKYRRSVHG